MDFGWFYREKKVIISEVKITVCYTQGVLTMFLWCWKFKQFCLDILTSCKVGKHYFFFLHYALTHRESLGNISAITAHLKYTQDLLFSCDKKES